MILTKDAFRSSCSRLTSQWLAVFLLVSLSGLTGCSPPQALDNLAWNAQITIPFSVSTYGLWDLADPDSVLRRRGSGIGLNGDSSLYFTSFTVVQISLQNSLAYDPYSFISVKPEGMQDSTTRFAVENQRHRLIRGVIAEGGVSVRLTHDPTDRTDTATVTLADLTDSQGRPLVIQRILSGAVPDTFTIELVGYTLTLDSSGTQYFDTRLQAPAEARVVANVDVHRLVFRDYYAFVSDLAISSEEHWTAVEQVPEGWEAVHPVTVDAYVHLRRSFTGNGGIVTDVSTFLNGTEIGRTHVEGANINFNHDTTLIVHDLAQLVSTFPDQVVAQSRMTLNGYVHATANDVLQLTVELRAPIEFRLTSMRPPGEVQRIDTEDLEDVESGAARIRIWNRLPLGGRAFLVVDRDSMRVLQDAGADVDTVADITVPVGPIVAGRATGIAYTESIISLTPSVIALLEHPPFYSRLDLYMPGTNGDTLIAHGTDFIRVQVIGEIEYRVELGGD